MRTSNFYTPESIKPLYDEIVPAYQSAFAGEPWEEVSKCVDESTRCVRGLSKLAVGSLCGTCGLRPNRPAYEASELVERLDELGASRQTAWYIEQQDHDVTLAAVAWEADADTIAVEKYNDIPKMNEWIASQIGEDRVAWLDEVFANRALQPRGNLENFGMFVTGLAARLGCDTVTYRTIAPAMTAAARRDFGANARIQNRVIEVPDGRDFITITNLKECV